ncbi:MAG: hypothetical protein CMF59_16650 [Leptospiraceae bacterium]|nr:hypothetical protein [Leptospiraceae bacterium]
MIQFPEKLEKQAANLFQRIMRRLVQEKARNAIQRAKTKAVVLDAVALDDSFDDFLEKLGLSEGELTKAEIRSLERLAKSVDNFTRKEALRVLADMRQLAEDPFMLGLAQESLDREGITVDALRSYVRENMQIIKDASLAANRDIEKVLAEGLSRGDTAKTIAKEIRKVADVSESYARFIARDQTGNLISTVSNRRYRAAGFPGYIWDATMDSRTRPAHAALHGKYFEFGQTPPGLTKPGAKEPGEDYQCVSGHHVAGNFQNLRRTYFRLYTGPIVFLQAEGAITDLMITPNHPVLVYDPEWDRVRWVAAGEIKKGYQLAYDSESVKVDAPGCMRVEALYQEGELDGEYELNRKDITNDPHHFHGDGVGSTHFSMRHIYKLPTPRFDPDFLSKGPRKIPHRQFEFRAIREITSQHVERHPVFNFETGHGWYTVSGVVVHNCRCVKVPSFGPQDEMSPEDRQRYIDRVNAERKEFGKQELEEAAS